MPVACPVHLKCFFLARIQPTPLHFRSALTNVSELPQPARTMRWLGLSVCVLLASCSVFAETNAPALRKLSLEDCIEIALNHNLDVQIKRYNPEIAGYTLDGLYGNYEPSFYLSAEHDYNQQPGGFDAQGRAFTGSRIESDAFSSGFEGTLPWGTIYNVGITMADQTTTRPPILGTPTTTIITNQFFDPLANNTVTYLSTNFASGTIPGISGEVFSGRAGILQLRQPLLKNFLLDNTRLQLILDRKNLQISELDVRSQVMTTVTAVEQAYYNLIYAQENIKVQRKAVELANRQLAENRKRVEVGAMAPLDEKQAQSVVASSQADLLGAQGTEERQQRVLKGLLSDKYGNWESVLIEPTASLVAMPSTSTSRKAGAAAWPNALICYSKRLASKNRVTSSNSSATSCCRRSISSGRLATTLPRKLSAVTLINLAGSITLSIASAANSRSP